MTEKQKRDIDCIKWFWGKANDATLREEEEYLLHSEKGIEPLSKQNLLIEGKRWRGITIHELWEQGILDGSVPYFTLLGGENKNEIPPRFVVDFMKKEMFKGADKDLIENLYIEIIK